MGGVHCFLFLDQPVASKDKENRLSIFEYIVDSKKFLKYNGIAPVFHQVLYFPAPFPSTSKTNYYGVRHSAYGNILAVQMQTYDTIHLYTICGYYEVPSDDPTKCTFYSSFLR